jgi:Tol biopolymer transport system component
LVARLRTAVVGACFVALLVAAPSAHAAFPGANGKIAFASTRDQPDPLNCAHNCPVSDIYTINPDGSGERNLTHNPADDTEPVWSADGSRIAFSTNRDGNYEVYTMDAGGGGLVRLTHDPAKDHFPSWSPDGSKIAFVSDRAPGCGIYVMTAADGSSITRVATTNMCNFGGRPKWSPDGTQIAFETYARSPLAQSPTTFSVFAVRPDGANLTTIAAGEDSFISYVLPDWSPDSTRLVIEDWIQAQPYLINRDGTGVVVAGPNYRDMAVWSPDGQRLAFSLFDIPAYAGFEIATSNLDGTGVSSVTNDHARNFWPDWQPIVNHSPDCSNVTATPDTLWPPNHKLVPVSLAGGTDPDGDQVTLTITGVTQDEPTRHIPDATLGPASNQVKLRAKRSTHGDGRVYRIAFKATDGRGGECSDTATVGVPRRKNRPAVDSAPPSYDSLVGTPGGGGQYSGDQHGNQG